MTAALAAKGVWRLADPTAREPYHQNPRPSLLPQVALHDDGRKGHLLRMPGSACDDGPPVLLIHGTGLSAHGYRMGDGSIAGELARLGFQVFLLVHRGDIAGDGANVDVVLQEDVPAAVERIAEQSSYQGVFVVGHGVGGVLAMAAQHPAIVGAIGLAPPWTIRGSHWLKRTSWFARLLPGATPLPVHRLAQLATPVAVGAVDHLRRAPGPLGRDLLSYATTDLSAGWVAQLHDWLAQGEPVSRGGAVAWRTKLAGQRHPLLVIGAEEDVLVGPGPLSECVRAWGGADKSWVVLPEGGHWDLLLDGRVHAVVAQFLLRHAPKADFEHVDVREVA